MDANILISAIEKAIAGGAIAATAPELLGPDAALIRTQTDVAIDGPVFDAYVAALKADTKMTEFDGIFANVPHGGGVGVGLSSIARVLLARAIVTQDVPGTVKTFIEAINANETEAIAVMGIAGVRTAGPIQLGPDIRLISDEGRSPLDSTCDRPRAGAAQHNGPALLSAVCARNAI